MITELRLKPRAYVVSREVSWRNLVTNVFVPHPCLGSTAVTVHLLSPGKMNSNTALEHMEQEIPMFVGSLGLDVLMLLFPVAGEPSWSTL